MSSATAFSSSAVNSTTPSREATSTSNSYNRDDKSSSNDREWKVGNWCWLTEQEDAKEEQEDIVAEDVNIKEEIEAQDVGVKEEQETALSPERPSQEPIHTYMDFKQTCHSHRHCQQAKRKAAATISSAVEDEGSDEDYKGDITEDFEEDSELINNCSNSKIQGPKRKEN